MLKTSPDDIIFALKSMPGIIFVLKSMPGMGQKFFRLKIMVTMETGAFAGTLNGMTGAGSSRHPFKSCHVYMEYIEPENEHDLPSFSFTRSGLCSIESD